MSFRLKRRMTRAQLLEQLRREARDAPDSGIVEVFNYGRGREVKGTNLLMKFWGEKGEVSYPWRSLDTWFVTEDIRWGKFAPDTDIKALVDKVNRDDGSVHQNQALAPFLGVMAGACIGAAAGALLIRLLFAVYAMVFPSPKEKR